MTKKITAQIASELGVAHANVCLVGSTLTCGKGNDVDLLCFVPSDECLIKAGFAPDTELRYESALHSWRRDGINIIATQDRGFFLSEIAIAYGAKLVRERSFDMTDRDDRIAFHSEVRLAVYEHIEETTEEFDFL